MLTKKVPKVKIKRDVALIEAPYEFLFSENIYYPKRQYRPSHRLTKALVVTDAVGRPKIPAPPRVFLYMQMQSISQIPDSDSQLELQMRHSKSAVTRLEERFVGTNAINISNMDVERPVFSMTIEQDCLEEMNTYSDNPLLITLYKHMMIKVKRDYIRRETMQSIDRSADEEFEEKDVLVPIAQGHIDLLKFFCNKRLLAPVRTYLYPIMSESCSVLIPTCRITWEIYTLLPLLKYLTFCNIVFITFESIYNPPAELLDIAGELTAELSFQSTIPSEKNMRRKLSICTFTTFIKKIISEQNVRHKWASMIEHPFNNYRGLGVSTNCEVNLGQLFKNVLRTDGVNFGFDDINIKEDYALICNAMHRYILTENVKDILHNAVACGEQQIVVDVYRRRRPKDILLQGTLDLSVLLYPRVNACRFAVALKPIIKDKKKATPVPIVLSEPNLEPDPNAEEKTIFAIINICLLAPISENTDHITIFNENELTKSKVKSCTANETPPVLKTETEICAETYIHFDQHIGILIDYIVKQKLKSAADAQKYFCCNMKNLSNRILRLIQYDFNIRYPTKTNKEFTNLMTTVYKELIERVHNLLQNCSNNRLDYCNIIDLNIQSQIIRFMGITKLLKELGDDEMASFLLEKTKKMNPNDPCLGFFLFIYNVENKEFEEAKKYLAKPAKDRYPLAEYFCQHINIYIHYMEILKHEQTFNEALQYLLDELKNFSERHPRDIAAWILLYCLYRSCRYLPGMSFARWKYENLYSKPQEELPATPKSRWEIYNAHHLTLHTQRANHFYKALRLFLRLGLYRFAEIIFENIADECTELDRHNMKVTLKIMLNEVQKIHTTPIFSSENLHENERAYKAHINGHLAYARGHIDEAMENYETIIGMEHIQDFQTFKLSLLRYAFHMVSQEQYDDAVKAFEKCCITTANKLIASMGMGKVMYKLNKLKEAEKYFSQCTNYGVHIPDVWGYLALVNIKMGNNFKALESWKYAKLNPENVICDEVIQELNKIDSQDIVLNVDIPV